MLQKAVLRLNSAMVVRCGLLAKWLSVSVRVRAGLGNALFSFLVCKYGTVSVSASNGYLWIFNRQRNRVELGQLNDSPPKRLCV